MTSPLAEAKLQHAVTSLTQGSKSHRPLGAEPLPGAGGAGRDGGKESLPTTLDWRAVASCAARERAVNMAHGGARRSLWLGRQDPETDVKVKLHLRNK